MALGTLVGRGFVRIDADTKPAEKAIKALSSLGSLTALGALGGAIAPLTTATLGLASAFATAGGAATAFGVAVVPQFTQIKTALTKQTQAENAQTKATNARTVAQRLAKDLGVKYGQQIQITADMTQEAKDKAQEYNQALTTAQSATKAATQSQQAYKTAMGSLPPATEKTAEALQNLKDTTKSWSDTMAGSTMPIFTRGIQFLTGLIPKLTPIVQSTAREISGFVNTLGEGVAGKVFREFGQNVTKNGAGSLRSFLDIARNVIVGIIGLFNAFTPASKGVTGGLEQMTAKFATWSAGLGKSKAFQDFLSRMRTEIPKLFTALGQLISVFGKLTVAAGPFAGLSLRIAEAMAKLLDSIPMAVLRVLVPTILAVNAAFKLYALYTAAASAATWLFSTAVTTNTGVTYANRISLISSYVAMGIFKAAMIASALASKALTAAQWLLNAAMTANPIGLVIAAIALLAAGFIIAWKKSETFRNIVKGALNGVLEVGKAIGHWFAHDFVDFFTKTIPKGFQYVKDWVKQNWPWILGALLGPIALAAAAIYKNWGRIRDFFVSAWGVIKRNALDPIAHFFTVTLPDAGRHVRDAIVGAIRWMALKVLDAFGSIIHGAVSLFGWVPGVGKKLKAAEKAFNVFRDNVNKALGGIKDKSATVSTTFKAALNTRGKSDTQRAATGGEIFGPGTGTSDDVPIMASRGEHMWTAREVDAVGGHGAMYRMRAAARSGTLRGYASGGEVGVKPRIPKYAAIVAAVNAGLIKLLNANARAIYNQLVSMMQAGPSFIGLGGVGKSAASAMAYAQKLLNVHIYGWTKSQWPAWRSLGMGESGWRWNALNKSSGAYGIPQALPPGKMISAGKDWRTNAYTQVRWMASYIHSRYGTPAHAWSSWLARRPHWYDHGGWLMPGETVAYNGTGRPERVLAPGESGGASIANLSLIFQGPVGSQRELENWLVSAFVQLQRQGRIRVITQTGGR